MIGYVTYLAIQQDVMGHAREALPDAPVHQLTTVERAGGRGTLARQQLSRALRQVADRVEPRPVSGPPAVAGCN